MWVWIAWTIGLIVGGILLTLAVEAMIVVWMDRRFQNKE
jgi:hypothetical protein